MSMLTCQLGQSCSGLVKITILLRFNRWSFPGIFRGKKIWEQKAHLLSIRTFPALLS